MVLKILKFIFAVLLGVLGIFIFNKGWGMANSSAADLCFATGLVFCLFSGIVFGSM